MDSTSSETRRCLQITPSKHLFSKDIELDYIARFNNNNGLHKFIKRKDVGIALGYSKASPL